MALAVVGDNLWVLAGDESGVNGAITVLSPSLRVLATYPTGPPHPLALLFDGHSVWVGSSRDSTVTKMAPDGTVLATIEVEGAPVALGFDGERIWVTTSAGTLTRLSLDGEVYSVLRTGANPVAMAWDGLAMWLARPVRADVFSGTTSRGVVSRLEVHDAPIPASPSVSRAEEIAPPEADMAQYVLAQDQVQQIPGFPGWTEIRALNSFDLADELGAHVLDLLEGLGFQGAFGADECSFGEGTTVVCARQWLLGFESQEGATQFMERLRAPAYPFHAVSAPLLTNEAGFGTGGLDFETWFQEMEPEAFGRGAFTVETSAGFLGLLEQIGLKGRAEDDFHGWVRYGNLVSLLFVNAGVDLTAGEASVKEFLATRSGPFYTMAQFQDLLRAAYQGLKEGATRPPVEEVKLTYSLSVSISPRGAGTVTLSPPGGSYLSDSGVTITASPAPGYVLSHIEGTLAHTSDPMVFRIHMNSNQSITAYFKPAPTPTPTPVPTPTPTPTPIPIEATTPTAQAAPAPTLAAVRYIVGREPWGLAFDGEHTWVANSGNDTVTKLRAADGTNLGTFPVGHGPIDLAFDGGKPVGAEQRRRHGQQVGP